VHADAFRHPGRAGGVVPAGGGRGAGLLWRPKAPDLKAATSSTLHQFPPRRIWKSGLAAVPLLVEVMVV
jgi:hypothetical protein